MPVAALRQSDEYQEKAVPIQESWEARRLALAVTAEAASRLTGNLCGPDLEEFAALYGLHRESSFA